MKKISKRILVIIIILLIVIIPLILRYNSYKKIDSFYDFVNKEKIDKSNIDDDEVVWSVFKSYQDEVDAEVNKILDNMLNNKENYNMNILYDKLLNVNERNNNGIGILNNYIDLIDSSSNINEFVSNAIKVEKDLNVGILMNIEVLSDFKNTCKNIVYMYPASFDFGADVFMYNGIDYASYRALCKQYQIKILKLYGYDKIKARDISNKIYEFQKDIASKSQGRDYYTDLEKLYNIMTKEELKNIFTNVDIDYYLSEIGMLDQEYFSVVDLNNFIAINSYLNNSNLEILKEYLKVRILEAYSNCISIDYNILREELSNKFVGLQKEYNIEDVSRNFVKANFSDILDKEYSKNKFTSDEKKLVNEMIDDVISYYENDINNINWMSLTTKEKALRKLNNIKRNIGYDDKWKIVSNSYNLSYNLSLLENVIMINKVNYNNMINRLNDNSKINLISQTTVNAYYNVQDNSINFPCAFAKFIDMDKSYYENLGMVGMIIGHEITHAIDSNGANFDEFGNLYNWWRDEDRKKFNNLKNKVISYYSNYEINGIKLDGKRTVSENIADLGSVNSIVSIAKSRGATNDDMKKLFESFASIWASKYLERYQNLLIISDTHAPDKIRVDATLSSCDEFYKIYNIKRNDKMYISKKDRVAIW